MQPGSIRHETFVIERRYPASQQRVFAAFSDPARKRRWFAEGEKQEIDKFKMDFQIGGRESMSFLVQDKFVCRNDTVYMDIVTDQRIVMAYTMTVGDMRISSSQATIELHPEENGTRLIFTEQGAYFENSDGPVIRREGWSILLDQLAGELAQ